jgi:hypothetical protein
MVKPNHHHVLPSLLVHPVKTIVGTYRMSRLMGHVHHTPSTTICDGNESTRPKVKQNNKPVTTGSSEQTTGRSFTGKKKSTRHRLEIEEEAGS